MAPRIPGNLLSTAMAVMPHTDVGRALEMAMTMDVPFWPQLPNYSYYEDMYLFLCRFHPEIFRPGRRDRMGHRAYRIRNVCAGGNSFPDRTPGKCLEYPVVQRRRPGSIDQKQHAFSGDVLPGQPGQGTHRGTRLCRRESDGRTAAGSIRAANGITSAFGDHFC